MPSDNTRRNDPRPKRFPPPEFPPRRVPRFANTPPAIFPTILGMLGLSIALRAGLTGLALPLAAADLLAGISIAIWGFAVFAYLAKLIRRPGVVLEDLRVLPGRTGLATMTMGAMAVAMLLLPFWVDAAKVLLLAGIAGHAVLALLLAWLLRRPEVPMRQVNPSLHLSFVGFIVAGSPVIALGWLSLAAVLFWACLAIAVMIWALSVVQATRTLPPPALRPMLAIHLAPAALLATMAGLLGMEMISLALLAAGGAYAVVLAFAAHWILGAGVSPLWGGFTFPIAAFATALLGAGGPWFLPGIGLTAVALVFNPLMLGWVLKRWPGGRLAALTNAAEA